MEGMEGMEGMETMKEEAFEKELEAEEAAKETALSGNGTFNSGNLGTPEGSNIQFAMDTDFKTVDSTYKRAVELGSDRMPTSFIGGVTVDMRSAGRTKVVDDRQKKQKKKPKKKLSKKRPSKKKPKKKPGKKPGKKPTKPSGNKPTTFPPRVEFVSCEASCTTMDDISLSMMEKMNTEICVMQAVGWLDSEGKPIKDVMEKDIKDFPESVAAALS